MGFLSSVWGKDTDFSADGEDMAQKAVFRYPPEYPPVMDKVPETVIRGGAGGLPFIPWKEIEGKRLCSI